MLIDQIKQANIQAMKDKDSVKRGILSIIITKYKNLEVELKASNKEINDADLLNIIQKSLKELSDEKEGYIKVNNFEKANDISKQEEVISIYLPKQLSEEEIKIEISKLEDKSIPAIMKHFKTNFAGKVDMSLVNRIARGV